MVVTLFGILMLVKDEHLVKAYLPMLVTGVPPSSDGMVSAPKGFGDTSVTIVSPPLTI